MAPTDLVVIGGGLLGTATAFYAARRGVRVRLLEGDELASGASGAAFGGVSASIYSYAAPEVPAPYVRLSMTSIAMYEQLAAELGAPLDFLQPGSLDPILDEAELPTRRARVASLQQQGVQAELLDRQAILDVEPAVGPAILAAIHCPIDGHVTPLNVVWAFAVAARRYGAEIDRGIVVTGIALDGDRVVGVETSSGFIAAQSVLCSAGTTTEALLSRIGVSLPMRYSRGQMFVTDRLPPLLRTYLHNIKQTAYGTVVIGATREPDVVDRSTTLAGTQEMLDEAVRMVPALAHAHLIRSWAGIRSVPEDGYPVVGPIPGIQGAFVAVMHRGVTLAPVMGSAIAELVATGTTEQPIATFSLERFSDRSPSSPDDVEAPYAKNY